MQRFIDEQIESYKGERFDLYSRANEMRNNERILVVRVINNTLVYRFHQDFQDRKRRVVNILTALLERYKLSDTILFINTGDGYYWEDHTPVFNFSVPYGKRGLIFINFDVLHFDLLGTNLDGIKDLFRGYKPQNIVDDIYFKGGPTDRKQHNLRSRLSRLPSPFNLVVSATDYTEKLTNLKQHTCLLDLPGRKPWSVRLKYALLSERRVIRVSFYDSRIGETGHWRQYFDYAFKGGDDYIHLSYDVAYDKPLDNKTVRRIAQDIRTEYGKPGTVAAKGGNLSVDEALRYLHALLETYTQSLLQ